jgi:hypothetical protein
VSKGTIEFDFKGDHHSATIDNDGWMCDDAKMRDVLNSHFPVESGVVGDPVIRTLYEAARMLGGKVVSEEPDNSEPGTVY